MARPRSFPEQVARRAPASLVVLLFISALLLAACGGSSEAKEHYNTGVELQQKGQLQEAIGEYDEAIRLNPQDAKAYVERGTAYAKLNQYQRAIQDYDEAIRLDRNTNSAKWWR